MHIISGMGAGGSKQVFLDYQLALTDLGHEVIPCVRQRSYVHTQLEKKNIASHIMHYSRIYQSKRVQHQLQKLYHTTSPQWLIVHNPKDAALWRHLCPTAKILLIIHSNDLSGIPFANTSITVNPELQKSAQCASDKPCHLVPNGIMLPLKTPESHTQNTHITFGYLGKIRRSKGIFLLIDALSKLPTGNWSIIIQGEGHLKSIAWLYALYKGISHHITWKSWGPSAPFYQAIDILLVPSIKETFGLVILEALMSHKKVLSTRSPGPSWVLESLSLHDNICDISAPDLTTLLHRAICKPQDIKTITPEMVWKRYGPDSFKQSLSKVLEALSST